MILAALDRLEAAYGALIAALDSGEADMIESANAFVAEAVADIRAIPGSRDEPLVLERAQELARLAEAARIRVGFLTDLNRQRIDLLAAARGNSPVSCYGRDGRRAA